MSTLIPMAAAAPATPADPISERKRDIQVFAKNLLQETSDFLEHRAEVQGYNQRPRLPLFFLKSFNLLKTETKELNYVDNYLDFIPNGIQMQWITEFGPNAEFPTRNEDGFLEAGRRWTLSEEISQFYMDIIEYIKNSHIVTGRIPSLPHAYFMTMLAFQRRVESENNEEHRRMVQQIPGNMQVYLSGIIGYFIPDDYVSECTIQHYMQTGFASFNKTF